MTRSPRVFILAALLALGACAQAPRLPPFAATPYQPITRAEIVAVAEREWRLFGSVVDDGTNRPPNQQEGKAERAPGLWERVGEYWWIGLDGRMPEAGWTGKHDESGRLFAAARDEQFAWSAAFVSYVMRIAGAGRRFPYAADHATYVNAAAAGRGGVVVAESPLQYAPRPGDLVCFGREWAAKLRFADLPTKGHWPGHCGIVVQAATGEIDIIGGNIGDAVALTRAPAGADGRLVGPDGAILDPRHPWFVILRSLAPDGGDGPPESNNRLP